MSWSFLRFKLLLGLRLTTLSMNLPVTFFIICLVCKKSKNVKQNNVYHKLNSYIAGEVQYEEYDSKEERENGEVMQPQVGTESSHH